MATKLVLYGGGFEGVYDDRLLPLYTALNPQLNITRASLVEHNGHEWVATRQEDCLIIAKGHNISEVIKSEIAYLENKLGVTI